MSKTVVLFAALAAALSVAMMLVVNATFAGFRSDLMAKVGETRPDLTEPIRGEEQLMLLIMGLLCVVAILTCAAAILALLRPSH